MSIARFSVRQRVLVNLAFLILMLAGILVSQRLPFDVFPDISFNAAVIVTVWPGASADEVERLVTRKLEDEIQDVTGIKEWFSFSIEGQSEINIEWDESLSKIEQQASLNELRAALDRVADLPDDVEESRLIELSVSEVMDVCMVAFTDVGGVGEYALREMARDFERKIERIEGVRKGRLMAARDREIHVNVDRDRALQYDLTLAEISKIISGNNQNVPGGSFADASGEEITIRGLGNFTSTEALGRTVVRKNADGHHVELAEVATIASDFEKRRTYGYYNGAPTILVGVAKTSGADITAVVSGVRQTLNEVQDRLPEGMQAHLTWDQSIFVQKRISVLRDNLLVGICLVVLILWLTVGFRNSMLAILGVPFSFLTALTLFPVLGITINLLSLIGFVMVSGMLVDDAIIVIENIYRHIEDGEEIGEAVVNGTEEVMWPVIAAVCTTVAAFLPMLLVTGTTGEFMSILPKTVIACLIASLAECLIVLPAHYVEWGSRERAADALVSAQSAGAISRISHTLRARTDVLINRARSVYAVGLDRILENRISFLVACAAAFYFALSLSEHIRVDLFPSDFNQLFVTIQMPVDITIDQADGVVRGIEAALEPIRNELVEVSTYVGQGMTPHERPIFGSNYGVLFISFEDSPENVADPGRMVRRVRKVLSSHAAAHPGEIEKLIVVPPRNGPPIGKPVAVRVVTDDYDLAKQIASDIQVELSGMPGVYNIEDNMPLGRRELRVSLDEYRASLHGLTFQDLAVALRAANEGLVPSTFKDPDSDEDIDIRVLLREDQRRSAAEILDVELRTPENYRVKVGDVASIDVTRGYQRLYHYDAQRAVVVYADVDDIEASSVSVNRALKARFADIPLQFPGVELVFGGEFQETNRAFEDMGRAFFIALIAIYSILAAQFRSYLQPLIVMCVIILAYIGVVIGMYVFDYAISMYVVYAVVGLAGVVVNDSLVLIDFVNRERASGTPVEEAVRRAGERRFRAVLLTTLTTIAGLLPMALGISGVSSVFGPFAAAIVAGLSVASGLTLFVVPSLYLTLDRAHGRISAMRRSNPIPSGAVAPSN